MAKGIWGLLGAGFLLGSVGVKALTSRPAKKLYVRALAQGMLAKSEADGLVEQARAQFDDIIAEASYLNEQRLAGESKPVASKPVASEPVTE